MNRKSIIKLIITMVLAMVMAMGGASAAVFAEDEAPSLSKTKMTIRIGQVVKLKVKNLPEGAKVTFKSGKPKVVKVSSKGKLTPKKLGKTTIKATIRYKDGKKKVLKCKVTVKQAIVAVLDGGAAKGQKVWKALSCTTATPRGPKNGHAAHQIDRIKEEAPHAKILSLRVTDETDSTIEIWGVERALELAKKYHASVVYYSFNSDISLTDYEEELVHELIERGVQIVGPAGNGHGKDARKKMWLTNVKGATSVGAWGNGKRHPISNKHANVYVKASTTSAAAARYAGMLANGRTYGVHK